MELHTRSPYSAEIPGNSLTLVWRGCVLLQVDVARFSESASTIKEQLSVGPVATMEDVSSNGSSPQAAVVKG